MSSGIYAILHIDSGRTYIGSSINIKRRWKEHRADLRKGTHYSRYLQNCWSKYGEDAFVFVLVEECAPGDCVLREQWYLDDLRPEFNGKPIASNSLGYKHTEDAKAKIGLANKGRPVPDQERQRRAEFMKGKPSIFKGRFHTPEAKQKVGDANRGRRHTDEARQKMSVLRKGKTKSAETRQRMSDAAKARWARRIA